MENDNGKLDAIANDLDCVIEERQSDLYQAMVMRDLMNLSEEDLNRLDNKQKARRDAIILEMYIGPDDTPDIIYDVIEQNSQEAEELVNIATNGKGVKY